MNDLTYIPKSKRSKVWNYIWLMTKWANDCLNKVERYISNMKSAKRIKMRITRARRIVTRMKKNHHKPNTLIYMMSYSEMTIQAQGYITIYNNQVNFGTYSRLIWVG